ncbi:glycosyltransferase [bacterium]|nr:glycosyltransferase [bacterium]
MRPLISVIVPIYNSEKYLKKCVTSIINQTYRNLEILLINDGSTDNSKNICNLFAKQDNRVRVINKNSGGVSDSRNRGIKESTGEYITFLDSDDYWEIETLEIALSVIIKEEADILIWGYYADFLDYNEKLLFTKIVADNTGVYTKKDVLPLHTNENFWQIFGYIWNKLYKSEIIKKGSFKFDKNISLGEDLLFNASLLSTLESIAIIETPLTHYIQRPKTTLGTKFYHNVFELKVKSSEAKKNFLEEWGFDKKNIDKFYSRSVFTSMKSSLKSIINTDELSKREKNKYIDNILQDSKTINMLTCFKPKNIKESLFFFILKYKIFRPFLHKYFKNVKQTY